MQQRGNIAGIDIGSRSIELVLLNGGGPVYQVKVATTFDPLGQCEKILQEVHAERIVATGYGRKLFAESFGRWNVATITEIQAYALGASRLFPEARTVLDIGGQDTKVISLLGNGKVAKFEMNDRCAAGTGRFLEFMATALQVPLEAFGEFALRSDKRIQISSMCTVFAESEATSLMARGERAENIAMGLHMAIVQRTLSMLRRVGVEHPVVFAGGVGHNLCVRNLLEEQLGEKLIVPENPDMVGALGAALYGSKVAAGIPLRQQEGVNGTLLNCSEEGKEE
jgi:predicted CoA-substrate-specific enzyme activase